MSDFLTEVVLYRGIPFDKSYNHTIYFRSLEDQRDYFKDRKVYTFGDMSYQRINRNTIRVQMGYEDLISCNYLSIRNFKKLGDNPKTYYAFIDDITYVSDDVSEITYTLDVMQTYLPNNSYAFGECWIERQHSTTDNKGEHLEDDYLVGEYTNNIGSSDAGLTNILMNYGYSKQQIINDTHHYPNPSGAGGMTTAPAELVFSCDYALILGITKNITNHNGLNASTTYDNLPSSVTLLGIPIVDTTYTHNITISQGAGTYSGTFPFNTLTSLNTLMNYAMDTLDGSTETNYDDVAFAIVVPFQYLNIDSWHSYDVIQGSVQKHQYAVYFYLKTKTFIIPASISNVSVKSTLDKGYEPKNNKLFDYPYNMLTATNLNGKVKDFKFHDFGDIDAYSSIKFTVYGYFTGGDFEFVLIPNDYEHRNNSIDNAILTNDMPTVSWISNPYQTWLEQKSAQNILSLLQGVGQIGLGIGQIVGGSTVSGTARLITGTSSVGNAIIERKVAQTLPNTLNGQMSNSFNYAKGNTIGFQLFGRCLKKEFLEQIDNYFTMYGYAVKRVGTPNLSARPYYTYIQTAGCIIKPKNTKDGMTASVQRQIADIFDKGITFWKYDKNNVPAPNVGDYSVDNSPAS